MLLLTERALVVVLIVPTERGLVRPKRVGATQSKGRRRWRVARCGLAERACCRRGRLGTYKEMGGEGGVGSGAGNENMTYSRTNEGKEKM